MPVTKSATILPDGLSYFEYQRRVAHEVVIPWLANRVSLDGAQVGDFGAHHGGTLEALRDWGGVEGATGFELSPELVAASPFLPDGRFRLEVADVMALKPHEYAFDLVILHDVLEHIPDTLDALVAVRHSLESGGRVFVSFPPYYSGFGGHQQLAAGAARVVLVDGVLDGEPVVQRLDVEIAQRVVSHSSTRGRSTATSRTLR